MKEGKHTVNPSAPTRFQNPICQPSTFGAGRYHFDCVSSINNILHQPHSPKVSAKPINPSIHSPASAAPVHSPLSRLILLPPARRPENPTTKGRKQETMTKNQTKKKPPYPETMNPTPPTTCGAQYTPSNKPLDKRSLIPGRAVKPLIQNTVAPTN